jgi:DNA-binding MarR family transcriptional regulator
MSKPKREPDPVLDEDLYALVVYLHSSCNRDLLEAIGREQLSFSQLRLLERLRGGHMHPTVRQAAALIDVRPNTASELVDSLARRGLVRREPDDNDYRAKRITVTQRGEGVIGRLHAARQGGILRFTEELTAKERQQLHAGLRPLLKHEQIAACRPLPTAA